MKKIAAIFLLLFILVQAGPAIQALVNAENVSIFLVDEEKNDVKEDSLKEVKKEISLNHQLHYFSGLLSSYNHYPGQKDYLSHIPDNLTPPPNY